MTLHHTEGLPCTDAWCERWHTDTLPVFREGAWRWKPGTKWTTPNGPCISPYNGANHSGPLTKFVPPAVRPSTPEEPRMMQGYDTDGRTIGGGYHGDPHPYHPTCDSDPKCRPVAETPKEAPAVSEAPTKPTHFSAPVPGVSPRAEALEEAKTLITGDRNNQYGPPTQDFARTAALLNALGYGRTDANDIIHEILPSDVAIIVMQVKMSRLMHGRDKRDTWVDLAGYSGCGFECTTVEAKTDG